MKVENAIKDTCEESAVTINRPAQRHWCTLEKKGKSCNVNCKLEHFC